MWSASWIQKPLIVPLSLPTRSPAKVSSSPPIAWAWPCLPFLSHPMVCQNISDANHNRSSWPPQTVLHLHKCIPFGLLHCLSVASEVPLDNQAQKVFSCSFSQAAALEMHTLDMAHYNYKSTTCPEIQEKQQLVSFVGLL